MRGWRTLSVLGMATIVASPVFANGSKLNVEGTWWTEDKGARIQVTDCGDNTPCGKLVWFEPNAEGIDRDINNPDPKLKDQPLIGSRVFWGFRPDKKNWKSGQIYDAESGKTYRSKLKLQKDGTLKVKGCIGPICQGQTWTRYTSGE